MPKMTAEQTNELKGKLGMNPSGPDIFNKEGDDGKPPSPAENPPVETKKEYRLPGENGEEVVMSLSETEFKGLLNKGRQSDQITSRMDLQIKTLQEQNNQLLLQNQQLVPDARAGREVIDLQTNHADIWQKVSQVVQQEHLKKAQPQVTEVQHKITAMRSELDRIKQQDPQADVSMLEKMLDLQESQASINPAQQVNSQVQVLNGEVNQLKTQMITDKKEQQRQRGLQKLANVKQACVDFGVTLNTNSWEMKAITDLVVSGTEEAEAVKQVFRVQGNPRKPPAEPNNQSAAQPNQTQEIEQTPVTMLPPGNSNDPAIRYQSYSGTLTDQQAKIRDYIYGEKSNKTLWIKK